MTCRFLESKWRCWGDDVIARANPRDPFHDWASLPPYLDYQIASLFIHRILSPLRESVLNELQGLMNRHRPQDWFVTFLTSFVLLQNYELQMQFQAQFAARRQSTVSPAPSRWRRRDLPAHAHRQLRFLDMGLVNGTNSGAKTILAHYHYCCKGQKPFDESFNWALPKTRKMAKLDAEQSAFMLQCRSFVLGKGKSSPPHPCTSVTVALRLRLPVFSPFAVTLIPR